MGNQHSTTTHNKLSKPRTNTNSVGVAHNLDSPNPASPRPADLTAEGRQQIKDALLSPTADEFGSAIWASKNDSAIEATKTRDRAFSITSRPNSRTHSRSNSRSNSLSCFGSKQGSTAKLAGMADSKLSLVSPSHVDIAEAIRLLQQVKKNGSPEELAALHEVLEAPEEPAVPVPEPGISRRTSAVDRSSSSLIRRKSLLQTPGVGTRNSPVEGRRRTWNSWKTPKLEPEEESKWQPSPTSATRLSPQVALSPTDRTCDDSRPRAPTPSELDYSHLGNLQLGTLVVTNGAASPASSIKTTRPRHAEDEDYFSEAELGSSPLMMKSTRRRGHSKSKSASLPVTSPLSTVNTNDIRSPYVDSTPTRFTEKHTPSLNCAQSTLPDHWDDGWQDAKSNTNSAANFAQSYQADIPVSPFALLEKSRAVPKEEGPVLDETDSPKTQTARSFHRPIYDQLVPQVEIKVPAPSNVSSTPALEKPKGRSGRRPQPHTTDSGYSSGSSLRVAEREQQTSPGPILCHQCDGSQQDSDASHDNQPSPSIYSRQSTEKSPTFGTAQLSQLDKQKPSLKVSTDSASSSARSSTSEALLSPQRPKPVSSRASWAGTTEKPHKRFHRRKSLAEQLVVQSCQSIPEGTIPEVPTKVRAQFERRVSSTPRMDCLTQTYPTKNHVVAEDCKPEAPLPSWSEFKLLAELEPEGPPKPSMQGPRKSLSFFRRKSMSEESRPKYESVPIDGAFLGLIAASIGDSPYDQAMSGLPKQTVESPTYPHQLGASVPRSKSMVNISMDSKAAVEFARAHSKDLAVAKQVLPRQRRRSLHNLKIEAGEAKASKRRPQSVDVPPVPSIDTSKLLALPTAKPRGPRPEKQSSRVPRCSPSPTGRAPPCSQTASRLVGRDESCPPKPPQHGVNWEAQSKAWAQRRKSIGESLRPANAAVKTSQSFVDVQAQSTARSPRRKSMGEGLRPANAVVKTNHSTVDLPAQPKALGQRRKSMGEGLRPANAAVKTSQSFVDVRMKTRLPEVPANWGRFSGGLAYNYEGRGTGVGGSAGTRQLNSHASVKSLHFKHQYGVDLSDVPIMLQRV